MTSTHIETIKGRYEDASQKTNATTPTYKEAELNINRFWGGSDNGRMLQLTIQSDAINYIQLTKEQVSILKDALNDAFDDEIYPSE
jgi:hypothetical protein